MRIRFMLAALALLPAIAHAGLYKCTKDGHTAYQDKPCAKDSTTSRELVKGLDGLKGFPWSTLKFGMSAEEVKATVPGVEAGSMKHDPSHGTVALLGLKGLSVGGIHFEASFRFTEGRFIFVDLLSSPGESLSENDSKFSRIYSELSRKYGPSRHQTGSSNPAGRTLSAPEGLGYDVIVQSAMWKLDSGWIWLRLRPAFQNSGANVVLSFFPNRT